MNTSTMHIGATRARGLVARAARVLLLLVSALLLSFSPAKAQSERVERGRQVQLAPDAKSDPPARSKLRGHVVYDDTGRPVRRARVLLLADGSTDGTGPSALTNAQGDFVIAGVSAGRYFVIVEGPGLLTPYSFLGIDGTQGNEIDFNAFRDQFEQVSVDGNGDADVQVRARRGAAITGKVTYENGDPAINVSVTLLRRQRGLLREYLGGIGGSGQGTQPTDDRGVFRFPGLPPGEYLVSVAEQIEHGDGTTTDDAEYEGASQTGTPLVVTYYPSAPNANDAAAIKLGAGEEHTGVDITLVERGLYTLGGIVRDKQTHQPLAGLRLGIHLKEGEAEEMPLTLDQYTQTDAHGHWQFNEVPDGLYVLTVQPQAETDEAAMEAFRGAAQAAEESHNQSALERLRPPPPVQRYAARQQEIKIAGEDQAHLVVNLSAGGRITGTVVSEGEQELPQYLYIGAETADAGARVATTDMAAVQNGRFTLGGIQPGKVLLHVSFSGENGRYYVKSLTANGATYTREPLVIEDGMTIKNARVVLAKESAQLRGRVFHAAREERTPASGLSVVVVPADAREWGWRGAQWLLRTDLAGAFELSAPPGDYLAFVLPPTERPRALSADEIKEFSGGGQRVTLRAGKSEQLELTAPAGK